MRNAPDVGIATQRLPPTDCGYYEPEQSRRSAGHSMFEGVGWASPGPAWPRRVAKYEKAPRDARCRPATSRSGPRDLVARAEAIETGERDSEAEVGTCTPFATGIPTSKSHAFKKPDVTETVKKKWTKSKRRAGRKANVAQDHCIILRISRIAAQVGILFLAGAVVF
ncbi:hypothetical protein FB451DRAFT_1186257 [Mycena latifolia]|nr:hypothetical protein FB451DRAFT_1186257 [Mycena latifolia]